MSFIAGGYTVTFDGATVGQIENGITFDHNASKRLITGDNFAETPQDAVFRGMQAFAQYSLMEWDAASAEVALWPYGNDWLNMSTKVGVLDSTLWKTLALTRVIAASTPAGVSCTRAILAEGHNVSALFAPDLRTVPIRQRLYPDSDGKFGTLS